uniref:Vomeronasal type-1 receptor n=1 Tax=Loxodonta africana TaxID=9785 RepID=G3TX11_LOXAF
MIHVAHVLSSHAGPSGSEDNYQSLGTERMSSRNLTVAMIFLSQTTLGFMGSFFLLYCYIFLHFTGCRLRSRDLILRHLTIANSLVILSKGIPQTMAAFELKDFLNDFGCKLLFYLHRVARGVSIGTTCHLSFFQAITIGPRNSRRAELKVKTSKYTDFSIFLCWIVHTLINIVIPMYVTGEWNNKNITNVILYLMKKITESLYAALLSFPDVVCLGLMTWASASMVFILYRHKQRVQHIHGNNISPRSSPESRAIQTILVLVSTFVSLYTLSSIFQVCLTLFSNPSWWLVNISTLFTAYFPTLSPFVLMSYDSSVF